MAFALWLVPDKRPHFSEGLLMHGRDEERRKEAARSLDVVAGAPSGARIGGTEQRGLV